MDKRWFFWMFVAGVLLVNGQVNAEFKPDKNTTLLFHFNKGFTADYATGERSGTGTAALTQNNGGYWGEALIAKKGLCVNSDGLEVMYKWLEYKAQNNYDSKKGTIELWVKLLKTPSEIVSEKETEKFAQMVLISIIKWDQHGQQSNWATLMIDYNFYETPQWKVTVYESKKEQDVFVDGQVWSELYRNRFHLDYDIVGWNKEVWHHIAFTWDAEQNTRALFVDGKKIGTGNSKYEDKFQELVPEAGRLLVGGYFSDNTMNLPCVIDEVRISNIVRYTEDFVPPSQKVGGAEDKEQ
ncbi:MAG: LamG-like jellyroll fold domain-containing protein [Candidatus Omnitrophota bacterium]